MTRTEDLWLACLAQAVVLHAHDPMHIGKEFDVLKSTEAFYQAAKNARDLAYRRQRPEVA